MISIMDETLSSIVVELLYISQALAFFVSLLE